MSERLGEMLLHGGALTEEQLQEVLSAQSIYGGRLGTNLVEMGLLSEEDLARLLNEKLGVPCVDAASLESIPDSLLSLIPREMVQRLKVLPVALDGKRLTLAMADPSDFTAIDEVGFFTGLVVVPRVCSELRLFMALERYYGIKRVLHFIPVVGGVRTRMIDLTRKSAGLRPSETNTLLASGQEPVADRSAGGTDASQGTVSNPDPTATVFAKESIGESADHRPQERGDQVRSDKGLLAARFAAATCEAEVVRTLMSYLKEEFDRSCFLSVRRGSAVGVMAVAGGKGVSNFPGSVIALEGAALISRVLKERSPYLGEIPEGGTEGQITAKIGGQPGATVLLVPLMVGGATVACLLVQDEQGRLSTGLFNLHRVVAKAGLAFEMLGIRKKIGLV